MLTAITRDLNPTLAKGELTFLPRTSIDIELAERQHQQYQSALALAGCKLVSIPTAPGLADSVFIEDTALVLDEIAVLCRPGAESRRPEVAGVESVLKQYRQLHSIQSPGTVDGGDLLRVGKTIYAGLSSRTNQSGIDQLRDMTGEYGYTVQAIDMGQCLHLKSAVTLVGPGILLINGDWINTDTFGQFDLIPVDKMEPHAANALLIGEKLVYPDCFPRTAQSLLERGIDLIQVNVSELQKAEGAVTCCSLIIEG